MELQTAKSYRNYKRIGNPFTKNGKLYTDVKVPCGRCGGTGYLSPFAHIDGGVCFECRGGKYFVKTVRLYTEEEIASMERAANRRREKAQVEREERMKAAREKWFERNGFNSEKETYLVYGNTFPIKDELKARGCKFSPELKWHCADSIETPEGCVLAKVSFDQLYDWPQNTWEPTFIGKDFVESLSTRSTGTSEFIGEEKERLRNLPCTLTEVKFINSLGCFSYTFDYNGNLLNWLTGKVLEFEEGAQVDLTGTVKTHKVFSGNCVTQLNRCVVKAR